MSTPGSTITVTIEALTDKAKQAVNGFFDALEKRSGLVESLNAQFENGSAAINRMTEALGALISAEALRGFVDEALNGAKAAKQFEQALNSSGQASDEYREKLEAQRKAQSELTGMREEDIMGVQRTLIQFGVLQDQMPVLTGLTLDYAAAMGLSASGAAEALGRALQGQDIVLKGMHLTIDKSLSKTQQLALLEETLQRKVGGQAAAMKEAVGPLSEFKLKWDELRKSLGGAILGNVVNPLASGLTDGIDKFRLGIDALTKNSPQLIGLFRGVSQLVGETVGYLLPLIAGFGAVILSARATVFIFEQIKAALLSLRVVMAGVFGSDVLGILAMVRNLKDLRAAVDLIGTSLTRTVPILASATAGYGIGRLIGGIQGANGSTLDQAVQGVFSNLFRGPDTQAMLAGAQQLEISILRVIDAQHKAGAINDQVAETFRNQTVEIRKTATSANELEDKLNALAVALRTTIGTTKQTDIAQSLFDHHSDLEAKARDASFAAALLKGDLALLDLENSQNESAFKRGLISLQKYLDTRKGIIASAASAQNIPIQKALASVTAQYDDKLQALDNIKSENDDLRANGQVPKFDDQIVAQKEVDDLTTKIKELNQELLITQDRKRKALDETNDSVDKGSFKGGIQGMLNDVDKQPGFGAQAANAFRDTWTSAIDGVSAGISGLILGTKSWGQTLVSIGTTAGTALVENFVKLGVEWVNTHVFMAAVSKLFHAADTADVAAHTTAQVGIHAAGEGAKTGATGIGVVARGVLRLSETIYHGVLVAVRVGAHLIGEILMTGASLVQSLIRRAAAFLEAQPYIFLAAVKAATAVADIPYVGPILAPIAAATTFAALEALAVFKEGGYTGDGAPDEVAGLVHKGEVVIPAPRVKQLGLGFLSALHSGSFAAPAYGGAAGGGSGGSQGAPIIRHQSTVNIAEFGDEAAAQRWADSQDGDTWIRSKLDKHIAKYQK